MHDALAGGAIITFTLLASAATRFFGAFSPTTMVVSADNSSLTIFAVGGVRASESRDRKSTRLNSSHLGISYAVFCLKKKKTQEQCSTRMPATEPGLAVRRPEP